MYTHCKKGDIAMLIFDKLDFEAGYCKKYRRLFHDDEKAQQW